jgi:hypothetical protein
MTDPPGGLLPVGVPAERLVRDRQTLGDARLAERSAASLVDNAMRHNMAHGTIGVTTGVRAGHAAAPVKPSETPGIGSS